MKPRTTTKLGMGLGMFAVAFGFVLAVAAVVPIIGLITVAMGAFCAGYSLSFYITLRIFEDFEPLPQSPEGTESRAP